MQRPYLFCRNIPTGGRDGGLLGPEVINDPDSKMNKLWRGCIAEGAVSDKDSGFRDVAETTMVAFARVSMARDLGDYREAEPARFPPSAPRFARFFDFDFDDLTTENEVNDHMYPTITQAAWKPYLFIRNSNLRLLFHGVFGDPPQRPRYIDRYDFRDMFVAPY
jgi:hypothetical protein